MTDIRSAVDQIKAAVDIIEKQHRFHDHASPFEMCVCGDSFPTYRGTCNGCHQWVPVVCEDCLKTHKEWPLASTMFKIKTTGGCCH